MSEGSHNTQNDTPFALGVRQRKNEGKKVALQAKVDKLEAQNNKIAMKNAVIQEQYEKLFETLHETRSTQTASSLPLWTLTIIRVPPNTEGRLPST
ncbi:hypothetical protein FF2_037231 [Malus domestica]